MFADLPNNMEAEQALLGAVLVNNYALHRVSAFLTKDHFFNPLHGRIYEGASKLILGGKRATPITLKTSFQAEEPVGQLTVPQYLGRLAANATTIFNAEDYGRTIYDLSTRRKLIEIGERMIADASNASIETHPDTLIEASEAALASIAERGRSEDHQLRASDAALQAINMIAEAYQRDGLMAGLPTGLRDLDKELGGLAPSDLIVVASRPGMGKSALAAGIAYHNARRFVETQATEAPTGCCVGFFSLEMSAMQIMLRLIAHEVGVSAQRLRRGDFNPSDWENVLAAVEQHLGSAPIHFDQSGGISIAQLCARARRMKRKYGIGLLVVDYLQLLSGTKGRGSNRVAEVSEISSELKALAKELDIPVLALSQLSRQVESREDKRPQLADLRDSGAIEQDADVVLFIFREEYYIGRREPKKDTAHHLEWQNEMSKAKGKAELNIEKQRQGATGSLEVHFDAALTRFSDLGRIDPLGVAA